MGTISKKIGITFTEIGKISKKIGIAFTEIGKSVQKSGKLGYCDNITNYFESCMPVLYCIVFFLGENGLLR